MRLLYSSRTLDDVIYRTELDSPGDGVAVSYTVVRCRSCEALLMVITRIRGISCVDLQGIRSLTGPSAR